MRLEKLEETCVTVFKRAKTTLVNSIKMVLSLTNRINMQYISGYFLHGLCLLWVIIYQFAVQNKPPIKEQC